MNLIRSQGVETPIGEGNLQPARVCMMGVQIHNRQDDIGEVFGVFAVADELFVLDWVETQVPVTLERGVLPSDTVDPRYKVLEAVLPADIPVPDLILFRIQVFLASELPGLRS